MKVKIVHREDNILRTGSIPLRLFEKTELHYDHKDVKHFMFCSRYFGQLGTRKVSLSLERTALLSLSENLQGLAGVGAGGGYTPEVQVSSRNADIFSDDGIRTFTPEIASPPCTVCM
jgi:hypothetical protein